MREHFGTFPEDREVGKVFVVAPGSPERNFRKFGFSPGVYRSTRIGRPVSSSQKEKFGACTGIPYLGYRSSNVSRVEFQACTGLPKLGDRSTQSREKKFLASTGLPKMGDRSTPVSGVFCEASTGLPKMGDRSTRVISQIFVLFSS